MTILPGLTSTVKDRIPAFISALSASNIRQIALFPTCLEKGERLALYKELESIKNLRIPHVHLRSDCGEDEISYLIECFKTEAFNIHPAKSKHSYGKIPGAYSKMFFIENVDELPESNELDGKEASVSAGKASGKAGGLCPDFSHLESAKLAGNKNYVKEFLKLLSTYPIGCCHLSAIIPGLPNRWAGTFDHHEYIKLNDLDYLSRYSGYFPEKWASLELENSFEEQLDAIAYINMKILNKTSDL